MFIAIVFATAMLEGGKSIRYSLGLWILVDKSCNVDCVYASCLPCRFQNVWQVGRSV